MTSARTERGPAAWIRDLREYLVGVRSEFRKITWPSRQETVAGTIGVVVIVGVITAYLGVVDLALANAVQMILP